jgi:thiosulfate reductase cytochrome b subunit
MAKKYVLIYKKYERFWHWMQAILVIFLMITGFEIHGYYSFLGFLNAVTFHNYAAIALIVLTIFTIFWHFVTGEWKQYIPTTDNLIAYVKYYTKGIFEGAPHPTHKTQLSKLNPLQRLTYLGLKIVLFPLMISTGILYMLYRYPQKSTIEFINIGGLEVVAILHTLGAFLLVAFLVAHLYLTTTGDTIFSNIKAMLTGYEEIEVDENNNEKATQQS